MRLQPLLYSVSCFYEQISALPAETAEPMIFMKSVTVILRIGKVVFSLVLPGNGPDGVLVLVYHMTAQITKSTSALRL